MFQLIMAVTVCLLLVIVSTTNLALCSQSPNMTCSCKNVFYSNHNNSCTSYSQCPTWYFCENSTKQCKCGKSLDGMIKCNEESGTAYILN